MFNSNIRGNNKCAGHSECDAIIMDSGTVGARPEITANSVEASLIHEAAIGKIAGEQITKLMTLGLTEEEAEAVKAQFDRSYVTKDIYQIYSWFLKDNGYPPLPDISLGQRMTEYEDVYGLLYLKYRLLGRGKHRRIKHLIIDEMQDYSYLQYVILDMLFDCKMTILGDKAQTLDETVHDVCTFLPGIFGKKMRKITMNKSYRNTVQIASYAAQFSSIRMWNF